jgi:hypothetical protein
MKHVFVLFVVLVATVATSAQVFPQNEAEFDSIYARRIMMTEIHGVYIPANLNDALLELKRLSSPADLEKFKKVNEETVRRKLHFGLGRWMIVNWGFYEGSRLSHDRREAGLQHPDDMSRVLIVSLHRSLNGRELRFEEEVAFYQAMREQERLERENAKEIIFEETRKKD